MNWPVVDMEEMIEQGLIKLGRGKVISKLDIVACPGSYPIYSSARLNDGKFGEYGRYEFEQELITWSVDGGGQLFYRPKHRFSVTNVAGTLEILDHEKLDYKFLHYVLSDQHSRLVFDWTRKAHPSVIRRLYKKIPLPPLDDQKRIAYLLSKVEGLIAQRKQHLQHLDDLLKSVFLEMFGFLDDSFKNLDIDKLSNHADIISGATKGKKYSEEDSLIEVPYMRVANVQDGYFNLDEIKTISVTSKEINKYQLKKGDVLLTEGGDPDKLGRGSVWENQIDHCIHQNHIFRVRVNNSSKLNPYYLSALVGSRYGKSYFLRSAKQTTGIASINSTQLKNFPVVIPPERLQNQFAKIIKKIEGIKTRYQASLTDLENLYGALSQKAFKGELDLSRVPLPPTSPNP